MATLVAPPQVADEPGPRRKRWTRAECEALEASGAVDFTRYQLVEGELVDRMGQNPPHVYVVTAVVLWLQQAFGARFVLFGAPIDVSPEDNPTNQPEPDAFVLKQNYSEYSARRAGPADLQLVVEVSDATVGFDTSVKAGLYARAGIVEYWVLDVPRRRLIVHRNPEAGRYGSVGMYGENEPVCPLGAHGAEFRAGIVLPVK